MPIILLAFVLIAIIIALGFASSTIFEKIKVPDSLWLIFFGILIGPVLGIVNPSTFFTGTGRSILVLFSAIALLIVLFEAGTRIKIYDLFSRFTSIFLLSVGGMILSIGIVAGLASFFIGLPLLLSVLLGAMISGTSSPLVIPLVDKLKELKGQSSLILRIESLVTDALAIIVSLALIGILVSGGGAQKIFSSVLGFFSSSILLGLGAGILWASVWHRFKKYDFHYMLTIAFLFALYAGGKFVGGSGPIVVFMIGLVLGNNRSVKKIFKIKHRMSMLSSETRKFNSYVSFLVRAFFFVLIGILMSFSSPSYLTCSALIAAGLLGIRFFAIRLATFGKRVTGRQRVLMSILYPRGLGAAVLALIALNRLPTQIFPNGIGPQLFPTVVFPVILFSIIITTVGVFLTERWRLRKTKAEE